MEGTREWCALADSIFGDILPSRIMQASLRGAITNPLVKLVSMETYYMSMHDCPEKLHELMDMATKVYERYYDYLEENKLLLPTNGFSSVAQESFAFTDELPAEGEITSTKQIWGFLESQETTAVSPAMYGEFVYPYLTAWSSASACFPTAVAKEWITSGSIIYPSGTTCASFRCRPSITRSRSASTCAAAALYITASREPNS